MEPIELVPARDAQQYIQDLEDELSATDGEPVALVHDGTTGTSHGSIVEAEEHVHMEGTLQGTKLLRVLELLVASRHTFRIWWAPNGLTAPDMVSCESLDQLVQTIEGQICAGVDLAVRYGPRGKASG